MTFDPLVDALFDDTPVINYPWSPFPGKQTAFMRATAQEVLFGGAAGPGKTECLLHDVVGWGMDFAPILDPLYTAVIFRREFTRLKSASGLIERSRRWFPLLGGIYNGSDHVWRFPSGAMVYFAHMQHEDSKHSYQGAEFTYIGWDELTEFSETQYKYLFTRNRSPVGCTIPARIRATSNPGNIGHTWVKKRFINTDIVNEPKYFLETENGSQEVDRGTPDSILRQFIPATLADNPAAPADYPSRIKATGDPVLISQLLEGDWDAENKEVLVYSNFSPANISHEAEHNPDLGHVIWGVDDGYAYGQGVGTSSYHPRVILFGQRTGMGGINVFAELVQHGVSSYQESIAFALEKMGYPAPELVYLDSSAAMFYGALWNSGLDVLRSSHRVEEGIKNVRRMVCDTDGVRLLHIHPRCEYTIYEFGVYRNNPLLKAKVGELVPLKQDDHAMDALRYMVWHMRYEL